jgi:chromosome partitioning protein
MLFSELWESLVVKAIAGILTPIVAGALYYALRRLFRAFKALSLAEDALKAVARTQEDGVWLEGPGFWLKQPIVRPWKNYETRMQASIPILMIATAKGGVGKTTLSGSLAAYFAVNWHQTREDPMAPKPVRVLIIDSDFQGSMTTMTVPDDSRHLLPSKANKLFSGDIGDGLERSSTPRVSRPNMIPLTAWTVPAHYDLAQAENRVQVEWLLPLSDSDLLSWLLRLFKLRQPRVPRSQKDVRYLLAEALLDPRVQRDYDIVVIDSPPRLTSSHVQALCASTHILVPTILDRLSGDAVARYVDQIATHKLGPSRDETLAICPKLGLLGVVCTMVPNQPNLDLSGPLNVLRESLADSRIPVHIFPKECMIRQRPPYRECAGERIAYAAIEKSTSYQDLRNEVDHLGDQISHMIGVTGRGWLRRESQQN